MNILKKITIYIMSLLYIVIGIKHFLEPDFFIAIVPPALIYKKSIVLISGLIEIIMGFLLLFQKTRKIGAWVIICVLILVFPANIYLYISEVPREIIGISKSQALLRIPFQIPLILLSYWHSKKIASKRFSIICVVLFVATISYFTTI